jgi:hypothetical protein
VRARLRGFDLYQEVVMAHGGTVSAMLGTLAATVSSPVCHRFPMPPARIGSFSTASIAPNESTFTCSVITLFASSGWNRWGQQ